MYNKLIFVLLAIIAMVGNAAADCSEEAYVYLALAPQTCSIWEGYGSETYHIYVASGEFTDVSGLVFHLVTDRFGPEHIVSISTPADVAITGGDLFTGIQLLFSSRHLDHDPVLTIEVSNPLLYGNVETQGILLMRGGVNESVDPFVTIGHLFDIFSPFVTWFPPTQVEVPVGQDESFCFRAVIDATYAGAGYLQIVDPLEWVPASFEHVVASGFGIGFCGWNYTAVTVPLHVPAGTDAGTTNEVTIKAYLNGHQVEETTVLLRAVSPVANESSSWGRIKALDR